MPVFANAEGVNASSSVFNDVQGNLTSNTYILNPTASSVRIADFFGRDFDATATHDSVQRQDAPTCHHSTRGDILYDIQEWAERIDRRHICLLYGPAGSGKSTIALTIAKQLATSKRLGASYFFCRGESSSDIAHLFPTLAYQLSTNFNGMQGAIQSALLDDPAILSKSLEVQYRKLVLNPCSLSQAEGPIVVVIDALDECNGEEAVRRLVQVLAQTQCDPPYSLKFLLTSRLHFRVRQSIAAIDHSKISVLNLQQYSADADIFAYFQSRFSAIHKENRRYMRGVKLPWPSYSDLKTLVDKSQGSFIYASTLVNFVGAGDQLPHVKLRIAMGTPPGLDPFYAQTFSGAPKLPHSARVVASCTLMRRPLSIKDIAQLLALEPADIAHAFQGLESIFTIPDLDDEAIQPLHASLYDFLVDKQRSKNHYINPAYFNAQLLDDCVQLITAYMDGDLEGSAAVACACLNWCYHLACALTEEEGVRRVVTLCDVTLVTFLDNIQNKWLQAWLRMVDSLRLLFEDMVSAIGKLENSGDTTQTSLGHTLTEIGVAVLVNVSALSNTQVARSIQLVPAFANAPTNLLLSSSSVVAARSEVDGGGDWLVNYVNVFVDRDVFMRYLGGEVQHDDTREATRWLLEHREGGSHILNSVDVEDDKTDSEVETEDDEIEENDTEDEGDDDENGAEAKIVQSEDSDEHPEGEEGDVEQEDDEDDDEDEQQQEYESVNADYESSNSDGGGLRNGGREGFCNCAKCKSKTKQSEDEEDQMEGDGSDVDEQEDQNSSGSLPLKGNERTRDNDESSAEEIQGTEGADNTDVSDDDRGLGGDDEDSDLGNRGASKNTRVEADIEVETDDESEDKEYHDRQLGNTSKYASVKNAGMRGKTRAGSATKADDESEEEDQDGWDTSDSGSKVKDQSRGREASDPSDKESEDETEEGEEDSSDSNDGVTPDKNSQPTRKKTNKSFRKRAWLAKMTNKIMKTSGKKNADLNRKDKVDEDEDDSSGAEVEDPEQTTSKRTRIAAINQSKEVEQDEDDNDAEERDEYEYDEEEEEYTSYTGGKIKNKRKVASDESDGESQDETSGDREDTTSDETRSQSTAKKMSVKSSAKRPWFAKMKGKVMTKMASKT